MARLYTVDASVFINAFNDYEAGHELSKEFLRRLRTQSYPIVVPTLLLPEVAAVIGRGQGDAAKARAFADSLGRLPNLVLVSLDKGLAREAIAVAADNRLRGSDAVYAAVAIRFGSILVTLDDQQKEWTASVVSALYPAEALAQLV